MTRGYDDPTLTFYETKLGDHDRQLMKITSRGGGVVDSVRT